MKCEKCGCELSPSERSCPKCGRLALPQKQAAGEVPQGESPASPVRPVSHGAPRDASPSNGTALPGPPAPAPAPTGTRPGVSPRPSDYRGSKVDEKVLCARCMESFRDVTMYEMAGKKYCERCFQMIVDEKRAQPAAYPGGRVEIAAPPSPPRKYAWLIGVAFRVAYLLLIVAFIVAVFELTRPRPKWEPVEEFDSPPAFRPSSAHRTPAAEPLPDGTSRPTPAPEGSPPTASLPPVDLPITKGSTLVTCPVCGLQFTLGQTGRLVSCPHCHRSLRPTDYDLFPFLRYTGRKGDVAIFRLDSQEKRVPLHQEVAPGSGITLERLLPDGVLLVKSETLSVTEHRLSPPQKVQKTIRLEKFVPKSRDDETTDIAIVQGAGSITCDGQGTGVVYHANPVEIAIDAKEPRTFTVVCPVESCWKQFRVVVRAAPTIDVVISPDMDEVACPACGFIRRLASIETGTTCVCLNCKRSVRLTVDRLTSVKFLGIEDGAARLEHDGRSYKVLPGRELWPDSQLFLTGFREDGKALVKRDQVVTFNDYCANSPIPRHARIPVTWVLSKSGD